MACPESANFFYGEYGEYGVSRESMSNPGKPVFSFCCSIQMPLLSYAPSVFSVSSVFSVPVPAGDDLSAAGRLPDHGPLL